MNMHMLLQFASIEETLRQIDVTAPQELGHVLGQEIGRLRARCSTVEMVMKQEMDSQHVW
jgi:hypothetical protein